MTTEALSQILVWVARGGQTREDLGKEFTTKFIKRGYLYEGRFGELRLTRIGEDFAQALL